MMKLNELQKPEPHGFHCVWLIKNTKSAPITKYKTDQHKLPKFIPNNKHYNYGILTGQINNIIVVDIDSYKFKEDSIFIKQFPNYLKDFNTYTTQTANGGHHFYFNYDAEIKQTASEHFVDIRSDGGFVVGPESKTNDGLYKIYNDTEIIKIPDNLKEWLLNNLYKKKINETNETKNKKTKHYEEYENVEMTEDEKIDIVKHITKKLNKLMKDTTHKNFFKSYDDYLYFTSAMKYLNQKKLWDDFSQSQDGYNREANNNIWQSANKNMLPWFIKKLEFMAYELFKPKLPNKIKPEQVIDINKISNDYDNIYNNPEGSYIIKSDTGTGKTYSFSVFVNKNEYNNNFISIVSRVSLAEEQYRVFNDDKYNIPSKLYLYDDYDDKESYICQIDSILKIYKLDNIKDKIIFLDEFNSIIKYIISSSTLKNKRLDVFERLEYILKDCKLFIATDADISDMSIKFIDNLNIKYKYVQNKYNHNKGVKATEIHNENELLTELKNNSKWILCCDSKTEIDRIYKILGNKKILKITSDSDEMISEYEKEMIENNENHIIKKTFDDYDCIMYSPKVLYGVDSSMSRNVYCYYKEHTISSEEMIQQIARCRNIENLKFLFTKKSYNANLKTLKELETELKSKNNYANKIFRCQTDKDLYDRYFELYVIYEYNKLCDETNKFGHFINLLKKRGFIYEEEQKHTIINKKQNKKLNDEIKKELIDKIDFDNYKIQDINKILNIPREDMKKYAEYFVDQYKLNRHFLICSYLYKTDDEVFNILDNRKDFNINKLKDGLTKVLFLKKFKNVVNSKNLYNIYSNVKDTDTNKLKEEYKILFNEDYDFKNNYKNEQLQYKIYKHLFGDCVIKKEIKDRGKKRDKYEYDFKDGAFDIDEEIYNYRKPVNNKKKIITKH